MIVKIPQRSDRVKLSGSKVIEKFPKKNKLWKKPSMFLKITAPIAAAIPIVMARIKIEASPC